MDNWPTSREVEKVKPFAERAKRAVDSLEAHRLAFSLLHGENSSLVTAMYRAGELLTEAINRGVKGKDA